MKVYAVVYYNGVVNSYGVDGVFTTKAAAEEHLKAIDWKADKSAIQETELDPKPEDL